MRKDLLFGCSIESVCLLGHYELCMEVKKGLNRLARRLGIELNLKDLVKDLYKLVGEVCCYADGVQ